MKKNSSTRNAVRRESASQPDQLLADIAFVQIEEMIITRKLPPGSMISESQLAAEMEMGRTPVREALQRLRQIGFVEMLPRRGTLVAGVDIRQQLELLEVRRPLEELVVRMAALRATPEERTNLQRLAQQMVTAAERGDMEAWIRTGSVGRDSEVLESRLQQCHTTDLAAGTSAYPIRQRVGTTFEREDRRQTTTQCFVTTQAPARRHFARDARHAHDAIACRIRVRNVLDARIDDAVKRHAALCARECADAGQHKCCCNP